MNPYREMTKEDGDIFSGVTKGVVGLVAKPVVGVADGVKNVLEGVRDQ